jgi:RNA polymerase sigma factor (sigma-70 family)
LSDNKQRFEAIVLPHLDAAYNLARWLLRDDQGARDATQEAYLRGDDARPWLLSIVRNTCYTSLREGMGGPEMLEFDEDRDSDGAPSSIHDPEYLLSQKIESARVNSAIEALPTVFREVLVLRELEGLSYEALSETLNIPMGTVMSRLARARRMLKLALTDEQEVRA